MPTLSQDPQITQFRVGDFAKDLELAGARRKCRALKEGRGSETSPFLSTHWNDRNSSLLKGERMWLLLTDLIFKALQRLEF